MSKRVLACVLCGSERGGWVHPRLSMVLTVMARDQRYTVEFKFICDAQPFHFARNKAVAAARDGSFDALIMLDNDACAAFNPLDLIPLDGDVVCTATAFKLGTWNSNGDGELQLLSDSFISLEKVSCRPVVPVGNGRRRIMQSARRTR